LNGPQSGAGRSTTAWGHCRVLRLPVWVRRRKTPHCVYLLRPARRCAGGGLSARSLTRWPLPPRRGVPATEIYGSTHSNRAGRPTARFRSSGAGDNPHSICCPARDVAGGSTNGALCRSRIDHRRGNGSPGPELPAPGAVRRMVLPAAFSAVSNRRTLRIPARDRTGLVQGCEVEWQYRPHHEARAEPVETQHDRRRATT